MLKPKNQIKIVPGELVFTNLKLNQPSSKSFQVINVSLDSLEIVILEIYELFTYQSLEH